MAYTDMQKSIAAALKKARKEQEKASNKVSSAKKTTTAQKTTFKATAKTGGATDYDKYFAPSNMQKSISSSFKKANTAVKTNTAKKTNTQKTGTDTVQFHLDNFFAPKINRTAEKESIGKAYSQNRKINSTPKNTSKKVELGKTVVGKTGGGGSWGPDDVTADSVRNYLTIKNDLGLTPRENGGVGANLKYLRMTDEEALKYKNLEGKEQSDYLKSLEDVLSERLTEDILKEAKNTEPGAKKNILTTLESIGAGWDDAVTGYQNIPNLIKGSTDTVKDSPLSEAVNQFDLEGGAKIAGDFGRAGGYMIPSVLFGLASGGAGIADKAANAIGSTAMGVSSAGSTYGNTIEEGYSPDQARVYGIINGALEGFLQYALGGIKGVSSGGILKDATKAVSQKLINAPAVVQKIASVAASSGDEFTEEWLQAVIDPFVRNAVLGENNDLNPFTWDKLYQGVIGAVMGAGTNVPSAISTPALDAVVGSETMDTIKGKAMGAIENTAMGTAPEASTDINTSEGRSAMVDNIEQRAQAFDTEDNTFYDGKKVDINTRSGNEILKALLMGDKQAAKKQAVEYGKANFPDHVTSNGMDILISKAGMDEAVKRLDTNSLLAFSAVPELIRTAGVINETESITNKKGHEGEVYLNNDFTIDGKPFHATIQILKTNVGYRFRGFAVNNGYYDTKTEPPKGYTSLPEVRVQEQSPVINNSVLSGGENVNMEGYKTGDWVYNTERGNIGQVLEKNGDNYLVSFRNPETGAETSVNIAADQLKKMSDTYIPNSGEAIPAGEGEFIIPQDNEVPPPVGEMQPQDETNEFTETPNPEGALSEGATPEEVRAYTSEKVMTSSPTKVKPRTSERIAAAWDAFQRKMVDSAYTIGKMAKEAGDEKLYPILNNARQSRQSGEYMLGLSITGQKTEQMSLTGKRVGKSLADIWGPIKAKGEKYYGHFQEYLFHVHNIDRMNQLQKSRENLEKFRTDNPSIVGIPEGTLRSLARGNTDEAVIYREYLGLMQDVIDAKNKPVFGYDVSADQSRGVVQMYNDTNPEFKELAKDVYKYSDNMLQYRVDTGLISKEFADLLRERYPHYVPVIRDFSALETAPIEEENATEADRIFAQKKNDNTIRVARTIKEATGGERRILPIDESMAKQTLKVVTAGKMNMLGQRMLNIARAGQGGEYVSPGQKTEIRFDIEEPTETLLRQMGRDGMENSFVIFEDGKSSSIRVNDGVFEGLTAMTNPQKGPGWAVKANDMFKRLITGYNPVFIPRNAIKDAQAVGLYSKDLAAFAKNYPKAYKQMVTNGEDWKLYQAMGGFNSSFFDYNKNLDSKHNAVQRWTLDKIETANMMIEQGPRFAEFLATIEKGGRSYENLMQAMYNAADVTVNFGRSGTWGRTLNSTFVPFFNPSVQGFDKLIRRFTETKGVKGWTTLVIRAVALGIAPSIINALMYDDDDEYKTIDDRTKDTYYLFKMGDGVWAKIPKGRELSLFGSLGQRVMRAAAGEKEPFAGFLQAMSDQVSPTNPFTNNIAAPVISAAANKTWYGGSIESQAMQNLRPEDRYDQSTSSLAIWLGKVLKYSPKKINYLLDAYTGVIGDFALPLMTPKAEQNAFSKAFTVDTVYSNRISDDFYNAKTELKYQENDEPVSDIPSETDLLLRYYNKQAGSVSELYKEISQIENSTDSDSVKQQKVREIRVLVNGIEQAALQGAPELQKSIEKYYKDVDTEAPEEVQTRQAEIAYLKANNEVFGPEYALKTADKDIYEKAQALFDKGTGYGNYYKYYEGTRTTDGKAMPEKDRAQVLLDLNLDENDIANIYASAFEDKNTSKNKSISYAVENGASAVTFAKYKTQDFTGDGGNTKAKEWIIENSGSEQEAAVLYQMKIEDKTTKEENTIGYAMDQGVSPKNFIMRTIQASGEEGDTTAGIDVDLTGGQAITTAGSETVSGTKKRESMKNILGSGYTVEEKLYFYQKENPEDDNFVWAMVAGIPVDEYLKLQRDSWDIKGEKDENGKTISGSKKAAFVDYLDTLDLNDAQKGILMLQQDYTVDSSVKNSVREYINGLDLSSEDKAAILSDLKLTGGSGGGSGGSSKKSSAKTYSIPSAITIPTRETVKSTASGERPEYLNNLIGIHNQIMSDNKNAIAATLAAELEAIDNNPMYLTDAMKTAAKTALKKRYERA